MPCLPSASSWRSRSWCVVDTRSRVPSRHRFGPASAAGVPVRPPPTRGRAVGSAPSGGWLPDDSTAVRCWTRSFVTSAHVFGGGVTKLGKAKQVAGRVVLDGGPEWTVGPEYFGALLPGAAIHLRGRDGYGKLSRCPLSTP